ncbi:hypothetical protein LXL04_008612 [Taraxacum kok-saghyz]
MLLYLLNVTAKQQSTLLKIQCFMNEQSMWKLQDGLIFFTICAHSITINRFVHQKSTHHRSLQAFKQVGCFPLSNLRRAYSLYMCHIRIKNHKPQRPVLQSQKYLAHSGSRSGEKKYFGEKVRRNPDHSSPLI